MSRPAIHFLLAITVVATLAATATGAPATPPAEDIRELRGAIDVPSPPPAWPLAALAGAALAAAAAIALLRRPREVAPDVEALRALDAARASVDVDGPHAFSIRVSDAVRRYVERAFDIHAPRRTTDEVLADLMRDGSPIVAHRAELARFLGCCDLAKFARWTLGRDEMLSMIDAARAFVLTTAIAREPSAGAAR